MPSSHALLAPSSAKRWMACHPSAVLESREPQKDTLYTREGTLAHSVGEFFLCHYRDHHMLPAEDILKEVAGWGKEMGAIIEGFRSEAAELGVDFDEMLVTVHDNYVVPVIMDYFDRLRSCKETQLLVEERIDLSVFIPEGFGSSDAIIISDKLLSVYDLKYGKGVKVYAENNPQAMCYGLGALVGPGEPWPIEEVELVIIQPRLQNDSRWLLPAQDLRWWGFQVLRPNAQMAFKGEGDLIPGDHCRFCAVAPKCKALAQKARTLHVQGEQPETMDVNDLSALLAELDTIEAWISSVRTYALDLASRGGHIPGYKVVEGRSVRKIADQQKAMQVLADNGFDEAFYTKPKELKTITELERLLRKKGFQELLGDLVERTQGKPTLAPERDPRPELTSAEMDFQNIKIN